MRLVRLRSLSLIAPPPSSSPSTTTGGKCAWWGAAAVSDGRSPPSVVASWSAGGAVSIGAAVDDGAVEAEIWKVKSRRQGS